MWFKKKSVLQAEHHYDTEKTESGIDMRASGTGYSNGSIKSGVPSAADAGNYFYLPALGYYESGGLNDIGYGGYYWSSSTYPSWYIDRAYYLGFNSRYITLNNISRGKGHRIEPTFE